MHTASGVPASQAWRVTHVLLRVGSSGTSTSSRRRAVEDLSNWRPLYQCRTLFKHYDRPWSMSPLVPLQFVAGDNQVASCASAVVLREMAGQKAWPAGVCEMRHYRGVGQRCQATHTSPPPPPMWT